MTHRLQCTVAFLLSSALTAFPAIASSGQRTIENIPTNPSVSIDDVSELEGSFGPTFFVFTLSLSSATDQNVVVSYTTVSGTATTANNDYVAVSSTAMILAKSTSTTIAIEVNGDLVKETDETFFVKLLGATNATIGVSPGKGTIQNDDGLPSITIADVSELEGNSGQTAFEFIVTLSNPTDQDVTIDYATASGTANAVNADYKDVSGTATIAAKTTFTRITVYVNGDEVYEPDETFFLDLIGATNATISDAQAQGTIENDDPASAIVIDDVTEAEGNAGKTPFVFTIGLTNPTTVDVTVDWSTKDGTATLADNDYQSSSGTATIPAKSKEVQITIYVNGDLNLEPGSGPPDFVETFFVNLSNPTGAPLGDNQGEGRIIDDEATPALMKRFASTAGEEGIEVLWQFASAAQFSSVVLERARAEDGPWQVVDVDLSEQDGATVALDRTVEPGTTYFYRLVASGTDGEILFGPISVTSLTIEFALSNVYPNPMRDVARIDYAVARSAPVRLSVFDIQGREVAVLVDGIQRGGRHQVVWKGRTDHGTAHAGVYFVRYQTPGKNFVKRISLTR